MIHLLKKTALIGTIAILLLGCKKDYQLTDKQSILFQFEYINYDWAYQHNGFIIDAEGNVLTYNNPEGWNFPKNDMTINETEITENLSKCLITNEKIPIEELHKYSKYISNIASTKVSAMKNVAADAGSWEFICYQYLESNNTYKGYLIKMEGDFTCENLNFYSRKVVAWLRTINDQLQENRTQ